MLRRLGVGFLCAILSYPIGVVVGMFLVSQCSPNMHDRSMEAAMTGAFFFGPVAAVIGLLIGVVNARSSGAPAPDAATATEPPGGRAPNAVGAEPSGGSSSGRFDRAEP
jgi:hypothetical protein